MQKIKNFKIFIVVILVVIFAIAKDTFFIVPQTQNALILQFGKIVKKYSQPGLKIKIPFIQEVVPFENRLLHFNLPKVEVNAADQKRLVVDLFVRYKIVDTLVFFQSIGANASNIKNRLSGIVLDNMQEVIARFPLADMLSTKRSIIMDEIHQRIAKSAQENFGITVKDVRIIRADLPEENSKAIFERMISERTQEAKQFRAEGEEQAQIIKANAEREKVIIIAKARKQASIIKGEGEAKAARIYANAYNQDKKFFEMYRSFQAYEKIISPKDTTIILSPKNNMFLKYMYAK